MTMEGGALSVQRGDLVAGRYRAGEPLGPAWRAHDESGGGEVVLVPVAGGDGGDADRDATLDTDRWRDRRGTLPVTGVATGDAGAWLVAEPVAARTLADAVAQWGALPAEQVLLIAAGATTALSAAGPRISAAADHILLTDDGQVLVLPMETAENDLATLGTALHLAAEGRSPAEASTGTPRQPTLTALISGLLQDGDRAATLDRTFAELSRLGAPLDAPHGPDTLSEAQAASAAAAEDTNDVTQPLESTDVPTQTMSAAELLDDPDATHVSETADTNDATQPLESGDVPTQPMSSADLLAETGDDGQADADADSEVTRQVPAIAADTGDTVTTQLEVPGNDADGQQTLVTAAAAADEARTGETVTTQLEVPADDLPTHQVPLVAAGGEATQQVPASTADTDPTRPVPVVAAADAIDTSTQEIPSPDDSATRSLPIPAAAAAAPMEPQPAPQSNPFVAPTQAAAAVPPTQAATAVPPQPQPQHPAAPPTQAAAAVPPNPWLQPPQPQPRQGPWGPGPQAAPAPGPWGPGPNQPPYFPQQGPPPPKGNGGKTAAIIIGAVAAVAAVVSLVVVATRGSGKGSSDNIGIIGHSSTSQSATPTSSVTGTNFPTGSPSSSSDSSPTDSSSDSTSSDVTDTSSASTTDSPPDLTSTPFDPNSLNAFQTDKTPLDLNALVPQEFTDDKGVHYSLKAGSVQPCVQTDMSSNMQDILTSNSCSKEIAASFVDDSGQYLVSVKVLPLPDHHTATVVYNDLAQQSAADFGIWCPGSGPGSTACTGDYQSATIKQYREQQHRYIILSVALAVNHSQSTEIAPWLDAAAKKAVDTAGPLNWSGNQ